MRSNFCLNCPAGRPFHKSWGVILCDVRSTRLQYGAVCIWLLQHIPTTCLTSFFQALASQEEASLCWPQICAQGFLWICH